MTDSFNCQTKELKTMRWSQAGLTTAQKIEWEITRGGEWMNGDHHFHSFTAVATAIAALERKELVPSVQRLFQSIGWLSCLTNKCSTL